MDLSIVIVNYKSKEKLRACLKSIKEADLSNIKSEIIVIENKSGDKLEDLKTEILDFDLVESSVNLGMGGGNNLGINIAQGEFVLILNPDTILKKDSIQVLWKYIKNNPDVYIVGPKLLNIDGTLQFSCAHFPRPWTPIFRRTFLGLFFKKHLDWFLMKSFSHDIIKEVDWLMGSCLMIRRSGFEGFDERFFMYFEDIDVCRRAWQVDKKVVYNPRAEIIHHHARESARLPWYKSVFRDKLTQEHIKSWFKYFKKWGLRK